MKRKFTVNTRILTDLIPNHITTFSAFCEFINNSIQAKAKNIWIDIDYTDENEIHELIINKIKIKDDGIGVHSSELELKTLDIGTGNKDGGKGIGRFCAFQIGKKFTVETIGYNQKNNKFSKSLIPLSIEQIHSFAKVGDLETETVEEDLGSSKKDTGYELTIEELYKSYETEKGKDKNRKITQQFLKENIKDSIFERYPLKIFNEDVKFIINGQKLQRDDFTIGEPIKTIKKYVNKKGEENKVRFTFFKVKNIEDIRAFLMVDNAGLSSVANSLKYEANWLSPKIGGWYIYIESDVLTSDNYRNIDLDGLDDEIFNYKSFVKDILNEFFKEKNREFDNFTDKLKQDDFYPYKDKEASSKSKELLFDKLAYLVEDKYHLLNNQEKLRELIYPLIDKTIANGELENILKEILKLDKKVITQFHNLIEKSDLDDVIEFSEKVASKNQDLEFIEKIVYSDISNSVKERKELHKYLEKMLWLFGEQYNNSTKLLSDKSLENNLKELREKFLEYKSSKNEDNINEAITDKKVKSITDLFLYNIRVLDSDKREVLIVELKAPKVKISQKELNQVMRYAQEIEDSAEFTDKINYKILLTSSDFNKWTKRELKGRQNDYKGDNPYFYYKNEVGNIEISVIKWADLFENAKRKLTYLTNVLKVKDIDIEEKTKRDFADIDFTKIRSSLTKAAI